MSLALSCSSVCYCLLCTNEVVQVKVEEEDLSLSPKTPSPNPGSGSSSSSAVKLISHEQCSFVLFQYVLHGRDLPPNICNDTQIKLCKNDSKICIKYCNPCLTQLTHIHDLVAQLATLERELEERKTDIVLKFCSSSCSTKVEVDPPPNSATFATAAAARLPENERRPEEFMELRNAICDGLELLKPQSILAIVHNLRERKRSSKRPTLPTHAQVLAQPANFQTPRSSSSSKSNASSSSSVRLMKNVSISRIKLTTRGSTAPADIVGDLDKSAALVQIKRETPEQPSSSSSSSSTAQTDQVGLGEPMAYFCGVCGAIFEDHAAWKQHDDEGHHHDDDDAGKGLPGAQVARVTLSSANIKTAKRPTTSNTKKHKCTLCPATFGTGWLLKRHLQVHTGERPFQCPTCSRKFTQKHYLQAHLDSSCARGFCSTGQPLKKFKCPVPACPEKFETNWQVKRHLTVHTGEKPFQCTLCPAKFSQSGTLKCHLLVHSGEKPFQCPVCGQTFRKKGNMRLHLKRVHSKGQDGGPKGQGQVIRNLKAEPEPSIGAQPIKIKQIRDSEPSPSLSLIPTPSGNTRADVDAMFGSFRDTESSASCSGVVILEEKFVPDLNLQAQDLGQGQDQIEFEGAADPTFQIPPVQMTYLCGVCGAIFKDHDSLKLHDDEHKGQGHRQDAEADDARNLSGPIASPPQRGHPPHKVPAARPRSRQRKYKCTLCPAKFSCSAGVKRHLLVHTGENPFQCPSCSRRFSHKFSLQVHRQSVCSEGQRVICSGQTAAIAVTKHKCPEPQCPAQFSRKSDLTRHLRVHTGEKRFQCPHPQCPAKFSQSQGLKSHLLTHSGEKPFQCHLCPAKFSHKCNLKTHLPVHTGEQPFQCPSCLKTFPRKSALTKHSKRFHPKGQ